MFPRSPAASLLKVFWPPPNISAGEPLPTADTRESLTAQHVFTFVSLHVIITCNCYIVLKLLFLLLPSVDLSTYFSFAFPLLPPPPPLRQ